MAEPQASGERPPRGTGGRRTAALIALVLGLAGLAISVTGLATQLLPRQFSAVQKQQITNWEIAGRWQQLTAGQIFPASVSYQLSAQVLEDTTPLNLAARRIGIAPQAGCGPDVTTATAAAMLRRDGCRAVLRATYVDATLSYVVTVGVAVLPSDAAAARAYQSLSQPRLTAARDGVLAVRYRGTAAAMYDYSRQFSASRDDGPYVIMYSAGYADSRPRVPVTDDRYSFSEMTSMAEGIAQSVADALTAAPANPHCPGTPGC